MIQSRPVTGGAAYSRRRSALRRHGLPLAAAALLALAGGLTVGAAHRPAEQEVAERYLAAWARGDLPAMHGMLTTEARDRTPLEQFRAAHERAARTATATRVRGGPAPEPRDGVIAVPVTVTTRAFGAIRTPLELPFRSEDGEPRVDWGEHLVFPGLRRGERLGARTRLPDRAALLAADGSVLARGDRVDGTASPADPEIAASIVGALGGAPSERAAELRAAGVPPGVEVGLTGLERALDAQLRGTPGGELLAGDRRLGAAEPRPAEPVRSSVVPRVQAAAVEALAGRVGGIVAMDPRTGEVTAAAGIGLSGLQPPGSTFKIITLAGALQAGITSPGRRYPVETYTTLEGVRLENNNAEPCGGTLFETFAKSCNSVYAPMGAELGDRRLVEASEAFGLNRPPGIAGAATSTIPSAGEIGDDLAVGSTAIGQGRLQTSALQMAVVAATVAAEGRRPRPTLLAGDRPRAERAVPAEVARVVGRAMRAVVRDGTGTAAAIDGVGVAGKTGTAELRTTVPPLPAPGGEGAAPPPPQEPATTSWFNAYAPFGEPRVAVGVMLEGGTGGGTAAPAARTVLAEALRYRG
jgi:penicillin-binding protein A